MSSRYDTICRPASFDLIGIVASLHHMDAQCLRRLGQFGPLRP